MTVKPRLLIVSLVHPFPRNAGQQQRVYYKLRALREDFRIVFLTVAPHAQQSEVQQKLLELCDEAIVLPSIYTRSLLTRFIHKTAGIVFSLLTGLKFSNYLAGKVELSPARAAQAIAGRDFEAALFEYWHTHETARLLGARGIYTILDMHDILWRSYSRQFDLRPAIPAWYKNWRVHQYRHVEELAWNDYHALIAINQDELDYARQHTRPGMGFFYVPMGTDISLWPYSWDPALSPRRVAFYASLGSAHNQQDALLCYREIMPVIWQTFPDVELWIVGSNPPDFIKALERDPRVHVTGFIERPQDVLKNMSLVLCPWSGTYGFRSRVVEVMALGLPVVASLDAVHGMGFQTDEGIFTFKTAQEMGLQAARLLADESTLQIQSRAARRQVEMQFGYEATYEMFVASLAEKLVNTEH